jgi:hypothetical protein
LDVVAGLAGQLLTLHTRTVRTDGLGLLALDTPRNVLAFGGRNFITKLLCDFGALLGGNILALLRRNVLTNFLQDIGTLLLKHSLAILYRNIFTHVLALLSVVLGGAHLGAALAVLSGALLAGHSLALLLRGVDAGASSYGGALTLVDGIANILKFRPALLLVLGATLVVILQAGHGLGDVAAGDVRNGVALLLRGGNTFLLSVEFSVAFLL